VEKQEVETFLVLAEELHFGRCAERLRVSTARVSQTIRKLERRVGAPLFARTSRVVALTPLGRQFRDDLAPAYGRVLDALTRAISTARCLHVGFVGPTAGDFLVGVMAEFAESDVRIHEIHVGDMFGALRASEIDVVLTKYPVREPDLTVGPVLLREPRVLAVSAKHPLSTARAVSLNDLTEEMHLDIAGSLPAYWRDHHLPSSAPNGRQIRRGPAASTLQEALILVAAGKGVCGMDSQVARHHTWPGIAFVPLRDAPSIESGLVWRTTAKPGLIRAFAERAEAIAIAATFSSTGSHPATRCNSAELLT
jgi:DNA-binding transcriptional LysR family regulator